MKKNLFVFTFLILILGSFLASNQHPTYALGQPKTSESAPSVKLMAENLHWRCPSVRIIPGFYGEHQVEAQGFNFQVTPPGGSYAFNREGHLRYLSLRMDPFPFNGELSSSRITEVDTSLPPDERSYCWQPTQRKDVVVAYTHRFAQATPPPGLSQNIFLWNAPLDTGNLITAVGVTRSNVYGGYFAIVTQDFDFATGSGLLQLVPLPTWLDATKWHTIVIVLSQETATIKVFQGNNYAVVTETTLLHPPDPLGFEFSMDNEILPGVISPVTVPDQLDVAFYSAALVRR